MVFRRMQSISLQSSTKQGERDGTICAASVLRIRPADVKSKPAKIPSFLRKPESMLILVEN
jgi:hypothetical protein